MKSAFTLVEILVCITIIALLLAILFPVLMDSRKSSRKVTCQSNLRSVGQTVRMYVDDYDGQWADYRVWTSWNSLDDVVPPSARPASSPRLAGCPSVDIPAERAFEMQVRGYITGYAYNINIQGWNDTHSVVDGKPVWEQNPTTDKDFIYPATTVIFLDAALDAIAISKPDPHEGQIPYPYNAEKGWERHNGGANYLFCDNHVKWLKKDQVLPGDSFTNDGTKPSFALSSRGNN